MSEIPAGRATHVPAEPWTGRDDGPGPQHRRWWSSVTAGRASRSSPAGENSAASTASSGGADTTGTGCTLVGFASDEGVRRNHGRVGAFDGPRAIRRALGSLAFHHDVTVTDLGDVVVAGADLEGGHQLLGEVAGPAVGDGLLVVVGGGHETAYGTYRALRTAGLPRAGRRLGVVNLDAHFDLRRAPQPTSGTPFRQMADELGDDFHYWVVGISEPNNTQVLFDEARAIGARWLVDEECTPEAVTSFVAAALAECDDLHLTIDLDVLPAGVAPGVSAPAALGVPFPTLLAAARQVAASGKLRAVDVVELNPSLDVDGRTARVAARFVDSIVGSWAGTPAR